MKKLVPIGRFSKMTRLSIKALRLYDESGLLKPASVDPSSGYRYYDPAQANRAEAIRTLRSVDMSLDQIREILVTHDGNNPDAVHRLLVAHRERLAERLATQERMLAYLETLINREEGVMPYEVSVQESGPQLIASVKVTTRLDRIANDIGTSFQTIIGALQEQQVAPSGAPMLVYHDLIDSETEGDVEICIPVDATFSTERTPRWRCASSRAGRWRRRSTAARTKRSLWRTTR